MTFKHERFDRHSLFNSDDRSLVLDIIGKVSKKHHHNVSNMLFGLFDGYWYIGLESALYHIDTIPTYMLADLSELLDRVSKVSKPSIDE